MGTRTRCRHIRFPTPGRRYRGELEGQPGSDGSLGGSGKHGQSHPPDYLEWLAGVYVGWIQVSVSLHYDESMDSTVEREDT